MNLRTITDTLVSELDALSFGAPVTHVYNPLVYARRPYLRYLERYARPPKEAVLLGMNPGPWGMAQTGVPFGEVEAVKGFLKIEAEVGQPDRPHPKRPVLGLGCTRREVSGKRLWGWIERVFERPERFFARFALLNYCPLLFLEESGRNVTPNTLAVADRKPLLKACDRALRATVELLQPRHVVGIGRFAEARARAALEGLDLTVGSVTHPSPANPRANRGWEPIVTEELRALGIDPAPH